MRDEFSKKVKDTLARRVAYLCSNPSCRKRTCGPAEDENKFCSIGEAAHITAASKGGPRYDYSLTPEERSSINNGIWLCKNCARLIDIDEEVYPVDLLRSWKDEAERNASESLGQRHEDMIENTRYQDIEMNCKNSIDCLRKEVKLRLKKWCKAISLLPSSLHYATSLQALKSLSITCKRWSIVSCVHDSLLGHSSKRRECLSMKCVATNHSSF